MFLKYFQKLVSKNITPLCHKFVSNTQHGFLQNRSTVINVCIFKEFILNSFNNQSQTDKIYTDMEKSFDKINDKLLIDKLKI